MKHLKAKLKKLEEKMGKDSSKGQELAAELARLQEDVPLLQARAADLELQLTKAQEVRGKAQGCGAVRWVARLACFVRGMRPATSALWQAVA